MTPTKLKSIRQSLGLSAGRFAAILGVHISAVRKWEAGHRPIPAWLVLLLDLMQMPAVQRRMDINPASNTTFIMGI